MSCTFLPPLPPPSKPLLSEVFPPENQKFCDVFKGVEKEKIGLK